MTHDRERHKGEAKMRAFHNNQELKDATLAQLAKHAEADEIIRGTGWDGHKGCAIGCLLHEYDHSLLPERLGWPQWFGRVVDALHENVSGNKKWSGGTWVQTVTEAVPVGLTERDFKTKVEAPFLVMVLESTLDMFDHKQFPDVKSAIDGSIALWQRNDIGSGEWNKAARAAVQAAEEAEEAARAAARAAGAEKYDYFADGLLDILASLQGDV